MSIAIGTAPLTPIRLADHLNQQADNGTVTVSLTDGTVLSIQPDGSQQTRPAGTAGPWEIARINGNVLIYSPDGNPYAFAYFQV